MSTARSRRRLRRQQRVEIETVDHYRIVDQTLGGANVKDFLEDPANGDRYIAKLGRRNSDLEVVTEYIIYLAGRRLGVRAAEAKIATFQGHLRFLSKYFLNPTRNEELVHGIQLFQQLYDEALMQNVIGDEAQEQAMFTVQAILNAFGAHYTEFGQDVQTNLFRGLVDMIVHDAVIGLQDRHHSNWGVIVNRGKAGPPPRFAPLYDSARGLFCSEPDADLRSRYSGTAGEQRLEGYAARSKPLIGFDGLFPLKGRKHITHDQLVGALYHNFTASRVRIRAILDRCDFRRLPGDIRTRMGSRCSGYRIGLILTLLRRRVSLLKRAIGAS